MTAEELPLEITEPGVYTIPAEQYFADPVVGGSLSSTGARQMIAPSCPAKWKWFQDHPEDREVSDAMSFGVAAHHMVLGDLDDRVVRSPHAKFLTNVAKAWRNEQLEAGRTIVKDKDWATIEKMAEQIRANDMAAQLLDPARGKPEQTLVWRDSSGAMLRARLDFLPKKTGRRMLLPDYKTAVSADPESWSKSAANHGYAIQAAFYQAGVKALELDDDPQFLHVIQETTPPYLVEVAQLDQEALAHGRSLMRYAINLWLECRATDTWPSYGRGRVVNIQLPAWELNRYDNADPDRRAAA